MAVTVDRCKEARKASGKNGTENDLVAGSRPSLAGLMMPVDLARTFSTRRCEERCGAHPTSGGMAPRTLNRRTDQQRHGDRNHQDQQDDKGHRAKQIHQQRKGNPMRACQMAQLPRPSEEQDDAKGSSNINRKQQRTPPSSCSTVASPTDQSIARKNVEYWLMIRVPRVNRCCLNASSTRTRSSCEPITHREVAPCHSNTA